MSTDIEFLVAELAHHFDAVLSHDRLAVGGVFGVAGGLGGFAVATEVDDYDGVVFC